MTQIDEATRAKLTKITSDFQKAYKSSKTQETKKGTGKSDFFKELDAILEASPRAKKVVDANGTPEEGLQAFIEEFHPGWILDSFEYDRFGNPTEIQLIEDPSSMPFVFVNEENKMVYSRSVREGSPAVDDSSLKESDWDFYLEVTQSSKEEDLLTEFVDLVLNESFDDLEEFLGEFVTKKLRDGEITRSLRSLESLDKTQIEEIRDYLIPGRKTTVMATPRKAKPEELS